MPSSLVARRGSRHRVSSAPLSLMTLNFGQNASTYTAPLSAYQYVILSPSMYASIPSIRAAAPQAQIYAYKNAASTMSGETTIDQIDSSSGVLYTDAIANHPTWFLKSARSNFTFSTFPTSWWMDIGNQAYRDAWIRNVRSYLPGRGWDGVFIDDSNFTPGHGYDGALEAYTDVQYGTAMRDFLNQIGDAMHAVGLRAGMNAGTDPWDSTSMGLALNAATHLDFFFREFFMHWSATDTGGVFKDATWTSQMAQMEDVEAITRFIGNTYPTASTDTATTRYGRACFLLGWSGRYGSASQSRPDGNVNPYKAAAIADPGLPVGARYAVGVGWRRNYTAGTVLVNPSSTTSQTFALGGTFVNASGDPVSYVTLAAADSAVLTR